MKWLLLAFGFASLSFSACSLLAAGKSSSIYESLENQTLFKTSSGQSETVAMDKGRDETTTAMTNMSGSFKDASSDSAVAEVQPSNTNYPDTMTIVINSKLDMMDPTLNSTPLVMHPDSLN